MTFRTRRVLTNASLELGSGECVGLVGENGSGKTTLLRILVGLLDPGAGVVTRRGTIGYCPQETLVFDGLTVEENFEFFAAAYGLTDPVWRSSAEQQMAQLNFAAERHRLAGLLSGGTRQKLNLSLALLANPAVLILDEPYAGFDWDTYLRFWRIAEALKARGNSVVVVSHLAYERERFDRLLELHDGSLRPMAAAP